MKKLIVSLWLVVMTVGAQAQTKQQTVNYSYDANGRLTSAYYTRASTNMAILFTHDLNNNRNTRTDYGLAEANGDLDGDDLTDTQELSYFGDLGQDGAGDPDADGLANSNELNSAGNPLVCDTDDDQMDDLSEFIAGTALNDDTRYFSVDDVSPVSGVVQLTWAVKAGRTYQLQKSDKLTEAWSDLGTSFDIGIDGIHSEEHAAETNICYRVAVYLTTP